MITDVPGIRLGHATDEVNYTGCTVILCPENTVGGVEVRGPAPGERETVLLSPEKSVPYVNAVLLTGGSAFGLAAADGVMRYLEEQGIGHWTPIARVPIVPAAVVYDLFMGDGVVRPDAEMGYAACQNATAGKVDQGNVGAGMGVTVGKWGGSKRKMKGGFGSASMRISLDEPSSPDASSSGGELIVGAAAVVNSIGDVLAADGSVLAGARDPEGGWLVEQDPLRRFPERPPASPGANTTLVVVATNAKLTKLEVNQLAQRAQDGLAISIRPVHTRHDGDTVFALATGTVQASLDLVANAAVDVVAEAIRNGVLHAATVKDIPGLYDLDKP